MGRTFDFVCGCAKERTSAGNATVDRDPAQRLTLGVPAKVTGRPLPGSGRTGATSDAVRSVLSVTRWKRPVLERYCAPSAAGRTGDRPWTRPFYANRRSTARSDAFYAQPGLSGARGARRHTAPPAPHECDDRCGPHRCGPLGEAYLRQIHNLLNGAFNRGVSWRWVGVNPSRQAQPPPLPRLPDPHPPSPRAGGADR